MPEVLMLIPMLALQRGVFMLNYYTTGNYPTSRFVTIFLRRRKAYGPSHLLRPQQPYARGSELRYSTPPQSTMYVCRAHPR